MADERTSVILDELEALARAVLSLADTAGMPDSYWQTDTRVALARQALGVPEDGRYSHAHLWASDAPSHGRQR